MPFHRLLGILAIYAIGTLAPHAASAATFDPKNWDLTVYYTAVESFHSKSKLIRVTGCVPQECDQKRIIGKFPKDFVKAVHDEGTGRITQGPYAGKYLCWSSGSGYWVDEKPKNALGTALIPWVSAAADPSVMNYESGFRVVDCGKDDTDGSIINPATCELLKAAHWRIMDRFEPGFGGKKHLDLYIGEEDQVDFINSSPKEISVNAAEITLEP